MFSGETGTGKTSLAYLLGKWLNCQTPTSTGPCNECPNCLRSGLLIEDLNMADKTKVDDARQLKDEITQKPLEKVNRVVILDEAHAMTKQAQKMWLKVIENPRDFLYVFFCTTEPGSFIPDLRNRCKHVEFTQLDRGESWNLLDHVATMEELKGFTPDVAHMLYDSKGGRPRELVEGLQTWAEGGKVPLSDQKEIEAKLWKLVDPLLRAQRSEQGWNAVWKNYQEVLVAQKDNAENIRRVMQAWLWKALKNPNGKQPLSKVMNLLAEISTPLDTGEEKYQMATRLYAAWIQNSK